MTIVEKAKELKQKRAKILKQANKETARLEREFRADKSDKSLTEKIRSFSGKFYAIVGPKLKEAKEIEKAIALLEA